MHKLQTTLCIVVSAAFSLIATPAHSANLEAQALAIEPINQRLAVGGHEHGLESPAIFSFGTALPQVQTIDCPPFESVDGFTDPEIQALRDVVCVDNDAGGMGWWAFLAITAIAIYSVPVLATQREALNGSTTTSFRQLDDRRSLLMPAGLMLSIWLFGLILFVT